MCSVEMLNVVDAVAETKKKPSQKFLGRLFDFSMCLLLSFRLEFVRWILLACQAALAVVFPLFCVLEYFCRL